MQLQGLQGVDVIDQFTQLSITLPGALIVKVSLINNIETNRNGLSRIYGWQIADTKRSRINMNIFIFIICYIHLFYVFVRLT